jgi:hypothetical protein
MRVSRWLPFALVLVWSLFLVADSQGQVVAGGYYNPYTGRGGAAATAYNPYTGARAGGVATYNPYTGYTSGGGYAYNPMTGNGVAGRATYNPYTGNGSYAYSRQQTGKVRVVTPAYIK